MCVGTRYVLSTYLDSPEDEFLQLDILADLGRNHSDNPAYQIFMIEMYGGGDPMEFREWTERILAIAKGKISYSLSPRKQSLPSPESVAMKEQE